MGGPGPRFPALLILGSMWRVSLPFPSMSTVVWLDQAGSGGSPLELRGTANWMGNTNELCVGTPKLLPCADSKEPAGSSVI